MCVSSRRNISSVGGDVPVDDEALVVTPSISRPDPSAQSFGGAHRSRMCVCAFIGVSVCACKKNLNYGKRSKMLVFDFVIFTS
jgi:hypothetical protein